MKKITFWSFVASCFCFCAGYGQINPIEVTGYNEDVIANGIGPMSGSTSIPIDADNFVYLSEDWKLNEGDADISVGLPADGIITSPNTTGLTYQIPTADAPYEGNNSLRIGQSGAANAGTMTFSTPENYSDLYFLVTSGSGTATIDVTVNFSDGSSEEFSSLTVPDWYQSGLPIEASGIGRGDRSNNNVETPANNPKIFQMHIEIDLENQGKHIEEIVFTKTDTGNAVFNLFAMSGVEANDCLAPSNIVISNIMGNSADVDWVANGEETVWDVEYGPSGFEPGSGTVINDDDGVPGISLNGLTVDTDYDVYVTAICGEDEASTQIGAVTFTTPPCPEDIESLNDEGACGAIVNYNAPVSSAGGSSENLILNPDASDGLNNWNLEQNGGSGWATTDDGFITSYVMGRKSQEIILADNGFSDAQMDDAPAITISEDYVGGGDNLSDTYFLVVELRDADGGVIETFSTGNITTNSEVQTVTHTFDDYDAGVRSVYFAHGGRDAENWTGQYGSIMTNAEVVVDLPAVNVVQTEGLSSGSEFPVGVTANTFEITEGDGEPVVCSFNVTVLDIESPEVLVNDITVELNEDQTITLSPEDIDAGSTDNCGSVSMSLDVASLNCDNIGENEVILTVTDENGNSNVATSIVTVVDPGNYCNLNTHDNKLTEFSFYPNPTQGEFTIESDTEKIDKVEVYDISGRKVKVLTENAGGKTWNGDILTFAPGVYFLKISSGSQSVVKKITKK